MRSRESGLWDGLLWLAVMAVALVVGGCGNSTTTTITTITTPSMTAATASSSTTDAAASASSSIDSSSNSTTTTTITTITTPSADAPTVADLERALAAEIEAEYPVGPGVVDCEASGELGDWQPVFCTFVPDQATEFGGVHVAMLDGGRFAWALGECCGAAPWPDDYPSGLFCRDLVEPPPGIAPDHYQPETDHLTYGLAIYYWLVENRPDRMDADLDGQPCETVYPASEVAAFWDSVRPLP